MCTRYVFQLSLIASDIPTIYRHVNARNKINDLKPESCRAFLEFIVMDSTMPWAKGNIKISSKIFSDR